MSVIPRSVAQLQALGVTVGEARARPVSSELLTASATRLLIPPPGQFPDPADRAKSLAYFHGFDAGIRTALPAQFGGSNKRPG